MTALVASEHRTRYPSVACGQEGRALRCAGDAGQRVRDCRGGFLGRRRSGHPHPAGPRQSTHEIQVPRGNRFPEAWSRHRHWSVSRNAKAASSDSFAFLWNSYQGSRCPEEQELPHAPAEGISRPRMLVSNRLAPGPAAENTLNPVPKKIRLSTMAAAYVNSVFNEIEKNRSLLKLTQTDQATFPQ